MARQMGIYQRCNAPRGLCFRLPALSSTLRDLGVSSFEGALSMSMAFRGLLRQLSKPFN